MNSENKKKWNKAILLSLIVSFIYIFNFFHQVRYGASGGDTYDHLNNVRFLFEKGRLPSCRQPYPMFFYVIAFFVKVFNNYTVAALLFTFIWSFSSNFIQIWIIGKLTKNEFDRYALWTGSALSFIWPISFHVFDGIRGISTYNKAMIGLELTSGTPSPYHNLTYLCAKPFALITLYAFFIVVFSDIDKEKNRALMAFVLSLSFFLSVLAKPCFYQSFAPAGTIFCIILFIMERKKYFARCCLVAVSFIPATVWVIRAMTAGTGHMEFSPFESVMLYNSYNTNVVVIMTRAIVYALFVSIILALHKKWDKCISLGIVIYAVGAFEWLFLIIPENKTTLDTMWGYNIAIYVLFIMAVVSLRRMGDEIHNSWTFIAGNVLLGMHSLAGLVLFTWTWIPAYIDYITNWIARS